MWQEWVTAVLGVWTIIVPFIGLSGAALMWTLVVTGAVMALISIWGAAEGTPESGRLEHSRR